MIKRYTYQVKGTTAEGQTWTTEGAVECEWHAVFDRAMRETFQKLTQGEAVFGHPGLGCRGPYDITEMRILRS